MAKILTVDDEPLVRKQIGRVLQRHGHEVYSASNGQEALKLSKLKHFDLALVDYNLPMMDGLEILQKLRELQPGCVRILLTGMLNLDLAIQAVNRGEVTRFVEKPFKNDQLMEAINDALDTRLRMVEVARVQQEASRDEERRILDECLKKEYIHVALQPLVSSRKETKGTVLAFEALLRSSHTIFDGPLSVIRATERHKRLDVLSQLVFERVKEWFEVLAEETNFLIFVNIHPKELADGESFLERLRILEPWSDRTIIEITERARIQAIDSWENTLNSMLAMGFHVAVDDLGAGYSSLGMLADLQPSYIKMDMSIIRDIHLEPRKQRLVELLSKFADATHALLITEGVENIEEVNEVLRCGTHLLQGYYFAKPSLDPEVIKDVLGQQWTLA